MTEFDDLTSALLTFKNDFDTTVADGQAASAELHKQLDAANATIASLQAGNPVTTQQITDLTNQLAAAKAAAVNNTAVLTAMDASIKTLDAGLKPPAA